MIKRIGCLDCISANCDGCNLKNLEEMLDSGRLDILMDNHTIDPHTEVAPVKHGRWVKEGDFLICLECESEINIKNSLGVENHKNYCPNCGAKMDGGAE